MINLDKKRPPLYLITGLLLGAALGLAAAWWFFPVQVIDTHPASLRADFKDAYRAAIAAAYGANGDLGRAEARLALLGDTDPARALASQAQVILSQGGEEDEARALGLLAAALGEQLPTALASETAAAVSGSAAGGTAQSEETQAATPTATPAPKATGTAGPSTTPSSTPAAAATVTATTTQGAAFVVDSFVEVCDINLAKPLIQVYVYDAARRPVPGIEVLVSWDGGEDHFFTGLQPDHGLEYADFEMTPGILYAVNLAAGEQPVNGVTARECEAAGGVRHLSSWKIVFVQP